MVCRERKERGQRTEQTERVIYRKRSIDREKGEIETERGEEGQRHKLTRDAPLSVPLFLFSLFGLTSAVQCCDEDNPLSMEILIKKSSEKREEREKRGTRDTREKEKRKTSHLLRADRATDWVTAAR